jgi:nucleotide-binding universal stress UspA family protein
MKVLLVIDGSSYSQMTISMLKALKLPRETQVMVMTVVPDHNFLGGLNLDLFRGKASERSARQERQREQAASLVETAIREISAAELKLEGLMRWGNPAESILKVAKENGASLILMGAKGLTDSPQFFLGGVAQKVMRHAGASVLLVKKETAAISRVLLATDGSGYSEIAAQFLLSLPLPRSEVVLVTAVQSYIEALIRTPTLDLKANQELIAQLQAAEEEEARKIITKIEQRLPRARYKTLSVVMRGGAAESILEVAKEYQPDLITLGASGLTGVEAFLLGNVAETVARHAGCSVLICRAPVAA